jgi:hypothetical protein
MIILNCNFENKSVTGKNVSVTGQNVCLTLPNKSVALAIKQKSPLFLPSRQGWRQGLLHNYAQTQ